MKIYLRLCIYLKPLICDGPRLEIKTTFKSGLRMVIIAARVHHINENDKDSMCIFRNSGNYVYTLLVKSFGRLW